MKNRDQMEYLTERTLIRDFIPYPRFLLNMKLTQTARILYALLLDRSKISRNNGWKNEKGYIYVIYPIDIVNIGLHFFLKNVRPYAASCSEA